MIGREDLIDDPRYATPRGAPRARGGGRRDRLRLDPQHDKHEAMRLIGAAGVPAGAVLDTGELVERAELRERGILQTMEHPRRTTQMPTWPVRHDGAPPPVKPSPLLGEHNADVLESWLGMSEGEIEGLAQEKVITRRK